LPTYKLLKLKTSQREVGVRCKPTRSRCKPTRSKCKFWAFLFTGRAGLTVLSLGWLEDLACSLDVSVSGRSIAEGWLY